jgi:putative hemolysin
VLRQTNASNPFKLDSEIKLVSNTIIDKTLKRVASSLVGLSYLDKLYQQLPPTDKPEVFCQLALDTLNIRYQASGFDLSDIPQEGPLVVVANHPFGCVEGVILAHALKQVRPDVKIMANYLLGRVSELSALFITVDPFGSSKAARKNLGPMKSAVKWLKNNGVLVMFPAGEVASYKPSQRKVVEAKWSDSLARLVKISKSSVLPIYFYGQNSPLFQALGFVHPRLRTALLARELINKQSTQIEFTAGRSIPYKKLSRFTDDDSLTRYLKMQTDLLARSRVETNFIGNEVPKLEPIESPCSTEVLQAEVDQLPLKHRLICANTLQVYYAAAKEIPWVMREIGRLREVTFRQVGEGTGKSIDLDLYDDYYLHLFLWDKENRCVVGGYRLGLADDILKRLGKKGLYTQSLFKYKTQLIEHLNPAIELGRSFVRPEYQKSFSPLMLLWQGIGHFVAENPSYRVLFGPVSISRDYQDASRALLVCYLKTTSFQKELARFVRPRNPFQDKSMDKLSANDLGLIRDIETVSDMVSQMERDQKGMPILLKQYLKFGGKLLSINVDDQFSDALDGLIMVDLTQTDPKVLAKYMGKERANAYLNRHQQENRFSYRDDQTPAA